MTDYSHNFTAWCRDCVTITDRLSGAPVPFILNTPQRRVLRTLEHQRLQGRPIRLIMLKARQWGGSTLIQTYMAWMQLIHHQGWNSIICAHVKDAAANIRGMYSRLLANYPDAAKDPDLRTQYRFLPYEKSASICHIPARQCTLTLATAQSPDSVRGQAAMMAHLSEVAFWEQGDPERASRLVRSITSTIPLAPDTIIALESTADGTDNYFHHEWQRATHNQSDKTPIFVPWHEIDTHTLPLTTKQTQQLTRHLDTYEQQLLAQGIDIQKIAWYHNKRTEYPTHRQMMAEYPSTPHEAFVASATHYFSDPQINSLTSATPPTSPSPLNILTATLTPTQPSDPLPLNLHTTLSTLHHNSHISHTSHNHTSDQLPQLIAAITLQARRHNAQTILAAHPDIPPRLIRHYLNLHNTPTITSPDDTQIWTLHPPLILEAAQTYRLSLSQGRITDPDPATATLLRTVANPPQPSLHPAAITLFLPSLATLHNLITPPLNPRDFL